MVIAMAAPATGAGGFSAPVRAAPGGCAGSKVEAGADGVSRGFVDCVTAGGAHSLSFISGQGASWQTQRATSIGGQLLEGADDGTATYALVAGNQPTEGLYLVKRTRAGRVSTERLSANTSTWRYGASLVARGGAWWAVWSEPHPHDGTQSQLYQAKTMYGRQSRTEIVTGRYNKGASLTLRPGGGVILAWRQESTTTIGDVWTGINTGRGWTMRRTVPEVTMPVLGTSGSRVVLIYTTSLGGCAPCPLTTVESTDGGATFGSKRLLRSGFRGLDGALLPRIAGSDGRTFIAYATPAGDRYAVVVAERTTGAWSETRVTSGYVAAADVSSGGGRAAVFIQPLSRGPDDHDLVATTVFAAPPKPAVSPSRSPSPSRAASPAASPTRSPSAQPASATPTESVAPSRTPSFTAAEPTSSSSRRTPWLLGAAVAGVLLAGGAAWRLGRR